MRLKDREVTSFTKAHKEAYVKLHYTLDGNIGSPKVPLWNEGYYSIFIKEEDDILYECSFFGTALPPETAENDENWKYVIGYNWPTNISLFCFPEYRNFLQNIRQEDYKNYYASVGGVVVNHRKNRVAETHLFYLMKDNNSLSFTPEIIGVRAVYHWEER